jgi:copper chaperone
MNSMVLQVAGMHCGGCVSSVQRALNALAEVEQVEVDLAQGRVVVSGHGDLQRPALVAAVQALGFDVTES